MREFIWTMANGLLTAVGTWYDDHDLALPERRFVSPGLPAWDCEQVHVRVVSSIPYGGNVAQALLDAGQTDWGIRTATYGIGITRCAPVMEVEGINADPVPPTVAELNKCAKVTMEDLAHVMSAVLWGWETSLVPAGCQSLIFGAWDYAGPEGGLVNTELQVTIGSI